jgi:hypothetical protein
MMAKVWQQFQPTILLGGQYCVSMTICILDPQAAPDQKLHAEITLFLFSLLLFPENQVG